MDKFTVGDEVSCDVPSLYFEHGIIILINTCYSDDYVRYRVKLDNGVEVWRKDCELQPYIAPKEIDIQRIIDVLEYVIEGVRNDCMKGEYPSFMITTNGGKGTLPLIELVKELKGE